MDVTKDDFLQILRGLDVASSEIDNIGNKDDSPLNYAFSVLGTLPEGNQEEHSHSVLKRSIELIPKLGVAVSPNDYAILFCASLLHDIAKSREIQEQVKTDLKAECKLFSHEDCDHGVRSAHHINQKLKKGEIKFYGLDNSAIMQVLNVISFHSTGDMHPCFLASRELDRKELLLCLAFWLADIADAADYRVPATRTVDEKGQSRRTKARQMVKEVSIERNYIVWWVEEYGQAVQDASDSENKKLSIHRLLLQAFGLPSKIIYLQRGMAVPTKDACLQYSDVTSSNLCLDVSKRVPPLVLSADTLPELYEKIVRSFYLVEASETVSHSNYFGPLVLEVRNVESDKAEETVIGGEAVKQIKDIRSYAQRWLDKAKNAEKDFYFGYTHGQRIWRYLYPSDDGDLDESFHDWHGTIDQFNHVVKILKKEGCDARRSYVVIPHPVIDNPESPVYRRHKEEVAPALIAIQFALEEDNRLSAFALLRSQELSIFFLVNYFEIRELLQRLKEKLADSITDTRLGRIVMMTARGYFAPGTPLLDKPEICRIRLSTVRDYARKLRLVRQRQDFIKLIRDFQRDYIRIETEWLRDFLGSLPRGMQFSEIRKGAKKLKKDLDSLEKERGRGGYSVTHPDIKETKKEAVEEFISVIEEVFK